METVGVAIFGAAMAAFLTLMGRIFFARKEIRHDLESALHLHLAELEHQVRALSPPTRAEIQVQTGALRASMGGEYFIPIGFKRPTQKVGCQHTQREPVVLCTGEVVAYVCVGCLERVTAGGSLHKEVAE